MVWALEYFRFALISFSIDPFLRCNATMNRNLLICYLQDVTLKYYKETAAIYFVYAMNVYEWYHVSFKLNSSFLVFYYRFFFIYFIDVEIAFQEFYKTSKTLLSRVFLKIYSEKFRNYTKNVGCCLHNRTCLLHKYIHLMVFFLPSTINTLYDISVSSW